MKKTWLRPHPARWGLRVRSAIIAGVVVAVAVGVAATALALVLYRSMISASDDAAAARLHEVAAQLRLDSPADLDAAVLSVDPRVASVQVLDAQGQVARSSPGSPYEPVAALHPPPGTIVRGATPTALTDGLRLSALTTNGVGGQYTVVVAASMENIENTIKLVVVLVTLGAPFIVATAALATYALIGRSLRSVERIRTRVAAIFEFRSQRTRPRTDPARRDRRARTDDERDARPDRIRAEGATPLRRRRLPRAAQPTVHGHHSTSRSAAIDRICWIRRWSRKRCYPKPTGCTT